jgi:hypothetical protein
MMSVACCLFEKSSSNNNSKRSSVASWCYIEVYKLNVDYNV